MEQSAIPYNFVIGTPRAARYALEDAKSGDYEPLARSFRRDSNLTTSNIVKLYRNSHVSVLQRDASPDGFLVRTINEALKEHPNREDVLSNLANGLAEREYCATALAKYLEVPLISVVFTLALFSTLSPRTGARFAYSIEDKLFGNVYEQHRQHYRELFQLS